jgi:predicted ATPase
MSLQKLLKAYNRSPSDWKMLRQITIKGIRGIQNATIDLKYPVTVLSGKNGCGKSSILQLASCAYKFGDSESYKISTFFKSTKFDPGAGAGAAEVCFKTDFLENHYALVRKQNRWRNYEKRPTNQVFFIGLERMIPPYERISANLIKDKSITLLDVSREELEVFRRIMNTDQYREAARSKSGSLLRLTKIDDTKNVLYSSYNMGCGEELMLNYARTFASLPENSLVLIDELECGLYPQLQISFMNYIADISMRKKIQFIITTHSREILNSIPWEFSTGVSRIGGDLQFEYCISPSYAMGKMHNKIGKELRVVCEDDVAQSIILLGLKHEQRQTVEVVPFGSKDEFPKYIAGKIVAEGPKSIERYIFVMDMISEKQAKVNAVMIQLRGKHGLPATDELRELVGRCMTGFDSSIKSPEEQFLEWLNETEFRKKAEEKFDTRDNEFVRIRDSIKRQIQTDDLDHHEIFKTVLPEELGLNREDVINFVSQIVNKEKPIYLRTVLEAISSKLEAAQRLAANN